MDSELSGSYNWTIETHCSKIYRYIGKVARAGEKVPKLNVPYRVEGRGERLDGLVGYGYGL